MCPCKTSWRRRLLRAAPFLLMAALAAAALLAGDQLDPELLLSYAPARPWLAAGMVVALFALKSLSVVFPTWILAVVSAIDAPSSPRFWLALTAVAGLILFSSGACLLFRRHHPSKAA